MRSSVQWPPPPIAVRIIGVDCPSSLIQAGAPINSRLS
jgi:hypothetical protein